VPRSARRIWRQMRNHRFALFGAPSPSLEGELFDMTLRVRAAKR
jgi:hypothetical protein